MVGRKSIRSWIWTDVKKFWFDVVRVTGTSLKRRALFARCTTVWCVRLSVFNFITVAGLKLGAVRFATLFTVTRVWCTCVDVLFSSCIFR